MEQRTYSADVMRAWRMQIDNAERLVRDVESKIDMHDDGSYKVELDPEDFLDLCAGKWINHA